MLQSGADRRPGNNLMERAPRLEPTLLFCWFSRILSRFERYNSGSVKMVGERQGDVGRQRLRKRGGEGGVGNLRLVSLLATSLLLHPTYISHPPMAQPKPIG